jgi:hypothetical protein
MVVGLVVRPAQVALPHLVSVESLVVLNPAARACPRVRRTAGLRISNDVLRAVDQKRITIFSSHGDTSRGVLVGGGDCRTRQLAVWGVPPRSSPGPTISREPDNMQSVKYAASQQA